jgi:hypothetical protein
MCVSVARWYTAANDKKYFDEEIFGRILPYKPRALLLRSGIKITYEEMLQP